MTRYHSSWILPADQYWWRLSARMERLGAEVGNWRQDLAEARGTPDGNNLNVSPAEGRRLHIVGAKCELAGQGWIGPIEWHSYTEGEKSKPDLGDFIAVKGVENPGYRLLIPRKQYSEVLAYLLVYARPPDYKMLGWIWGKNITPDMWGEPRKGRPCFCVGQGSLSDPALLRDLVRKTLPTNLCCA